MTPLDRLAAMVARMTPRPWAYGHLIDDQAGDYVIWKHRGPAENQTGGPQREFIGNVGAWWEPVVATLDDLAGQLFESERYNAAALTALANVADELLVLAKIAASFGDSDAPSIEKIRALRGASDALRAKLEAHA